MRKQNNPLAVGLFIIIAPSRKRKEKYIHKPTNIRPLENNPSLSSEFFFPSLMFTKVNKLKAITQEQSGDF